MSQDLSPETLVTQLMASPEGPAFSENLSPKRSEQLLSRYHADMVRYLTEGPLTEGKWDVIDKDKARLATLKRRFPTFREAYNRRLISVSRSKQEDEIAELRRLHRHWSGDAERTRYKYLKTKYAHRSWGMPAQVDLWGFETERHLIEALERREGLKIMMEAHERQIVRLKDSLAEVTGDDNTLARYRNLIEHEIIPPPWRGEREED